MTVCGIPKIVIKFPMKFETGASSGPGIGTVWQAGDEKSWPGQSLPHLLKQQSLSRAQL